MPLYAYTCTACTHSFDIQQSFTDDSLTVCPECAGLLRKVFSPVGVVFKGSGFYRTDSKASKKSTGSSSKAKDGSGAGSGSSESSSSSSTESSGAAVPSGSKDGSSASSTSGSSGTGSSASAPKAAAAATT